MVVTEDEVVEQVGGYDFTVRFADEETPEQRRRWDHRVNALTALLVAAWKREHQDFHNN
jgi:hypothetical protein